MTRRILTELDVHNIRDALALGYSVSMLARIYGVTRNTIRWVRDGLTFKG